MKKKKQAGNQEIYNLLAKKESFGLTPTEKQMLEALIKGNKTQKSLDESVQQKLRNVKTDRITPHKRIYNSLFSRIEPENKKSFPFYKSLYNFFTFKIPIYQAIGAAVVILLFITGIINFSENSIDKTYTRDIYLSNEIDKIVKNDSSLIYLMNMNHKGKSSAEDSSLTRFLVPAI